MSNNLLEKIFKIVAVILLGVAAFFLWRNNFDGVFISAVLGIVSFVLSYRFQLKERLDGREVEEHSEKEFAEENYRGNLFEADFDDDELTDFELENEKEKVPIER